MLKHDNLKAHGQYIRALLSWGQGDEARRAIYNRRAHYIAKCVREDLKEKLRFIFGDSADCSRQEKYFILNDYRDRVAGRGIRPAIERELFRRGSVLRYRVAAFIKGEKVQPVKIKRAKLRKEINYCPICSGTGELVGRKCNNCGGHGTVK